MLSSMNHCSLKKKIHYTKAWSNKLQGLKWMGTQVQVVFQTKAFMVYGEVGVANEQIK
jgi:hypothetical protein